MLFPYPEEKVTKTLRNAPVHCCRNHRQEHERLACEPWHCHNHHAQIYLGASLWKTAILRIENLGLAKIEVDDFGKGFVISNPAGILDLLSSLCSCCRRPL